MLLECLNVRVRQCNIFGEQRNPVLGTMSSLQPLSCSTSDDLSLVPLLLYIALKMQGARRRCGLTIVVHYKLDVWILWYMRVYALIVIMQAQLTEVVQPTRCKLPRPEDKGSDEQCTHTSVRTSHSVH